MNGMFRIVLSLPEPIKEAVKEQVHEMILTGLEVLRDVLIELSFSIALIGGGVCILLWLGGWKDGKRWAGILFIANLLIKFLLGGGLF